MSMILDVRKNRMNYSTQHPPVSTATNQTFEISKFRPLSDAERIGAAALGHTIRRLRRRHVPGRLRLSQADLARSAGLAPRSLAAIEQGRCRIQFETLEKLASTLAELLRDIAGSRDEILAELRLMAGPIVTATEGVA